MHKVEHFYPREDVKLTRALLVTAFGQKESLRSIL